MKRKLIFKACIAVLIVFTGLSMISCQDDYEPVPVTSDDIPGSYKAKLITTQGNKKTEEITGFEAKKDTIKFDDFQIERIVKTVVADPVKAEAAIAAIGKVKYNLNYTSKIDTQNNVVELTFAPRVLELTIPVDGTNKNTKVTFKDNQKGFYVGQDWSLRFGLVAEKIEVDGVQVTPYEVIKYDFPYCLKK